MENFELINKVACDYGITAEQLSKNLDKHTIAMLTTMAEEMILCGSASFGNGTFVNLDGNLTNAFGDIIGTLMPSKRFLDIYNNLLADKRLIL